MYLEGIHSQTSSTKHFVTLYDGRSRRLIIELPKTWEDLIVAAQEGFPHYMNAALDISTKDLTITDGEYAVLNEAVWDDGRTHIKSVTVTPMVPRTHDVPSGSANAALNSSARNVQDGLMLPPEDAYDQTPEPEAGPSRPNDVQSTIAREEDEQHDIHPAPVPSGSRISTHKPVTGSAAPSTSQANGYHESSNAMAREETRSRSASTDSSSQNKRKRVESMQSSQDAQLPAPVAAPAPKRRANLNEELSRVLPSRDEHSRGLRELPPPSPPQARSRKEEEHRRLLTGPPSRTGDRFKPSQPKWAPEPEGDAKVKLERAGPPVHVKPEKFSAQPGVKATASQSDDKFVLHIEYKGKKKAFRVRGGYTVWKVLNTACTNFSLPKPTGYDIMLCMQSAAGMVSCDNEDTLNNIGAVEGTVMELVGLGDDDDSDY